jgi:uncharacterized protein (TIGR02996 family)
VVQPDDESPFLSAIWADPADVSARFIYADWLEEQGDRRAEFLRVEARSDGSWSSEKELLELAANLNPLWVARVSRPPVGVCCDRVQFSNLSTESPRPRVDDATIKHVERLIGLVFPVQYRAFLLNYNGGTPTPNWYRIPGRNYGRRGLNAERITSFFMIHSPKQETGSAFDLLTQADQHRLQAGAGRDLLPIAEGPPTGQGDVLCLAPDTGAVILLNTFVQPTDDDYLTPVAPNLATFLARLMNAPPARIRKLRPENRKNND